MKRLEYGGKRYGWRKVFRLTVTTYFTMLIRLTYLWLRNRRVQQFLAGARRARRTQHEVLWSKLRRNADSDFGRQHGFASIRSVADFRRQLPISTYEDYRPYVERVKKGDVGAMFGPGTRVLMFALTSGTTEQSKFIPDHPGVPPGVSPRLEPVGRAGLRRSSAGRADVQPAALQRLAKVLHRGWHSLRQHQRAGGRHRPADLPVRLHPPPRNDEDLRSAGQAVHGPADRDGHAADRRDHDGQPQHAGRVRPPGQRATARS